MPRQPRIDQSGLLYHVFARGIERREIFSDNRDRDRFLALAGDILTETGTPVHAFALLPNHFHLLVHRHQTSLSTVMRRLLTAYAVYFNRRHERVGHLFQNRYRAIICQEDRYYLELIRYIHLNPIRAGAVTSLTLLDDYRYSGHSQLMGRNISDWYKPDVVLARFSRNMREARGRYHEFIASGLNTGETKDLDGGGLMRSMEPAGKTPGKKAVFDDRILGDGLFVAHLLNPGLCVPAAKKKQQTQLLVSTFCEEFGITVTELLAGSKRRVVVEVRGLIASRLCREIGLPVSAIARELSISTTAVSRILQKR